MLYDDEYLQITPNEQETIDSQNLEVTPMDSGELNEVSVAETSFATFEFITPKIERPDIFDPEMDFFTFNNNVNNTRFDVENNNNVVNESAEKLEVSLIEMQKEVNNRADKTDQSQQEDEKNARVEEGRKTKSLKTIHDCLWNNQKPSQIMKKLKLNKSQWHWVLNQYYDTKNQTILDADSLASINPHEKNISTRLKALHSNYNGPTTLVHFKSSEISLYDFWDALQKSGGKFEVACNYLCIEPRNIRVHASEKLQSYKLTFSDFIQIIASKTEKDIQKISGYNKKLSGDRTDHARVSASNLVKLIMVQNLTEEAIVFPEENDTISNNNNVPHSPVSSAVNESDLNKEYHEYEEATVYGPSLKEIHETLLNKCDPTQELNVSKFHLLRIIHQYYDSKFGAILESCDNLKKIKLDDSDRLSAIHSRYNNPSLITTINFKQYSFYDFWQALQKSKGSINRALDYLCVNLPGFSKGFKQGVGSTDAYQENIVNIFSMTESQMLEFLPNAQVKFADQGCKTTLEAAKALAEMFLEIKAKLLQKKSMMQNDNAQASEEKKSIFVSKLENEITVNFDKIEFDLTDNSSFKMNGNLVVPRGKSPNPDDLSLAMICNNLKLKPKITMGDFAKQFNIDRKIIQRRIINFRYQERILSLDLLKKLINENQPISLYSLHVKSFDGAITSKLGQISDRYSVKLVWFLLKNQNSCDTIKGYVGSQKFESTIKKVYKIDVDDLRTKDENFVDSLPKFDDKLNSFSSEKTNQNEHFSSAENSSSDLELKNIKKRSALQNEDSGNQYKRKRLSSGQSDNNDEMSNATLAGKQGMFRSKIPLSSTLGSNTNNTKAQEPIRQKRC